MDKPRIDKPTSRRPGGRRKVPKQYGTRDSNPITRNNRADGSRVGYRPPSTSSDIQGIFDTLSSQAKARSNKRAQAAQEGRASGRAYGSGKLNKGFSGSGDIKPAKGFDSSGRQNLPGKRKMKP